MAMANESSVTQAAVGSWQDNAPLWTGLRTGYCGSLTTFSAWQLQMVQMLIGGACLFQSLLGLTRPPGWIHNPVKEYTKGSTMLPGCHSDAIA